MEITRIPQELLISTGSFLSDPLDYFRFKNAIGSVGTHLSNRFILNSVDLLNYDTSILQDLITGGCTLLVRGPHSEMLLEKILDLQSNELLFDYIGSLTEEILPISSIVDLLYVACRQDSLEFLEILANQFRSPSRRSEVLNTTRGYENVLTAAIALKSRRILPRLIELGFDTNAVVGGSVSALSVALWTGDITILDYLLNVSHARMVASRTTISEFVQSKTVQLLPLVTQCYLRERFSLI